MTFKKSHTFHLMAGMFLCIAVLFQESLMSKEIKAEVDNKDYDSRKLRSLYENLVKKSPELKDYIAKGSKRFEISIKGKPLQLHLEKNAEGVVTHLGLNLFPVEAIELNPSIYLFIERLLLEYWIEGGAEGARLAKTEGIYFALNNIFLGSIGFESLTPAFEIIRASPNFKLSIEESKYRLEWQNATQRLAMSFPARQDLILGKDKIELDNELSQKLQQKQDRSFSPIFIEQTKIIFDSTKSVWKFVGKTFSEEYKGVKQSAYFSKKAEEFIPIWSEQNVEESLTNLFFTDLTNTRTINLEIKHNLYGNTQKNYKTTLKEFLSLFQTGYVPFIGFEKSEGTSIPVLLILVSERFAHLHLVSIQFSKDIFQNSNEVIKAKLTTNIRNDNLKSIFQEYVEKPDKGKYKVPKGTK
ncbi:MAG: hypothetical protein SFU91_08880 [Chloroherpetonaceae bacterium]|nr:hypothetical protein [Chloroherpetonaceae bacterium]